MVNQNLDGTALAFALIIASVIAGGCFTEFLKYLKQPICVVEMASPGNTAMVRLERTGDCDPAAMAVEARRAVERAMQPAEEVE